MSVGRKVKMEIDLSTMEEVCRKLGLTVKNNVVCRGWMKRPMENGKLFPLVVERQDGFDIGFTEEGMIADFHGGYVNKDVEAMLPAYYTEKISHSRFDVEQVEHTAEKIVIRVGRC